MKKKTVPRRIRGTVPYPTVEAVRASAAQIAVKTYGLIV